MFRKYLLVLLFIISFSLPAFCADFSVPLPGDAERVMNRSSNYGPMNMNLEAYKTSLAGDKIVAFYRQVLKNDGWQETKQMFFKKGNQALMINVPALKGKPKDGKTTFTIAKSNLPSREEMLSTKKDIPDKVNFMPIYPGSKQLFFFDNPNGASASYNTDDSANDVLFFYKSKMINYGWALIGETPLTQKAIQEKGKDGINISGMSSRAELKFKRNRESCIIHITEGKLNDTEAKPNDKTDKTAISSMISSVGATQILVTYNDFNKL